VARILVANDDDDLLDTCQEALEAAGHSVRSMANGALALQAARLWYPDAVLVDWKMPDMDGPAFIRALRGDRAMAAIPILMMSGSEHGAEAAAQAGADAFLPKPFNAAELSGAIDQLLGLAAKAGAPT
jgi:two-component system OmpR family response regulator